MSLIDNLPDLENPFFDKDFFVVYLSLIPHMVKRGLYTTKAVEEVWAEVYQGDFYGLLQHLKIDNQYHRFILSFNELKTPLDYTLDRLSIKIPDLDYIGRMMNIHRTSN